MKLSHRIILGLALAGAVAAPLAIASPAQAQWRRDWHGPDGHYRRDAWRWHRGVYFAPPPVYYAPPRVIYAPPPPPAYYAVPAY